MSASIPGTHLFQERAVMSQQVESGDANRVLARRINREARSDPKSPFAGKYVGIANGRVVVADPELAKVVEALAAAEPDRSKRMFIEASADYDSVHEVWCNSFAQPLVTVPAV